jgi:predicted Zn-dependent protease
MFPEFITLRTDPFDPRMPSSPWTGDWLPTRAMTWIDKGVIANLAYDRYWAEKTGKARDAIPRRRIRRWWWRRRRWWWIRAAEARSFSKAAKLRSRN